MNLFIFACLLATTLVSAFNLTAPAKLPAKLPATTSSAEVTDLIARLAPLAKDLSRYGGLRIDFWADGVEITLKTKDGNEYHGVASDLPGAVSRISDPSTQVRAALQGWGK